MTHLDERALAPAAAELHDARRAWPEAPGLRRWTTLRTSAELLAGALGIARACRLPRPPERTRGVKPEITALLHA